MKRLAEPLAVLGWVSFVVLVLWLTKTAPCPGEHHEPRINRRLVAQQPP